MSITFQAPNGAGRAHQAWPLRPDDAAAPGNMLRVLGPACAVAASMAPSRSRARGWLARMTQVNPQREWALVLVHMQGGLEQIVPEAVAVATGLWTADLTRQRRRGAVPLPRWFGFDADFSLRDDAPIVRRLQAAFDAHKLEDLTIALRIAATDAATDATVVLRSGSLADALRASIALPSMLARRWRWTFAPSCPAASTGLHDCWRSSARP